MLDPMILLVGVGLLSITCQYLAYKINVPAILPLLLVGIVLGPVLTLLDPDALFGELFFPLISLAVAIILFEGALTLKFEDLGSHGAMVRNLCSVGVAVTWAIATPAAHYALGMSWQIAALFGAIVTVTGPTVIVPLVRATRPNTKLANILRWEGIVVDPIGALLAVLVYQFIVATQSAWISTLVTFGKVVALGFGIGTLVGYGLGLMLRKNWLPRYLENTAVLTLMLGAYALSDVVAHESGLLTVTVMGIWLANMPNVDVDDIVEFKETLSVLLISALFILLAARLDFAAVIGVGLGAIVVLAVLIMVARPAAVLISSIGTNLNWRETAFLSWIAPRGIVAAAVSALFALKLDALGYPGAELLVPMVFLVIIATVVLQSLTAAPVAALLGVRAPPPNGLLLFGANKFARMLAQEMIKHEIPVLIADPNWESIREARMENIPTYYGNPISEHARRTMDLNTIGTVLVISPYRQINPLVTYHFEEELGKGAVFGLTRSDQNSRASHQISESYAKKLGLFAEGITYGHLATLVANGAQIRSTALSDEFTFENYQEKFGNRALPLVALNPDHKVFLYTASSDFKPKADWLMISLISPEPADQEVTADVASRQQQQ